MMTIMKKSIALLLAVFVVFGNLPLHYLSFTDKGLASKPDDGYYNIEANAADEDIYSYISSGGITMITGTKVTLTGAITLPSMLGGYPVAYIGGYAFEDCIGITSVSFPSTLTNIDDFAFYGCRALQSVTFSDNLRIIQSCAFRDCVSLVSFHMPDTVTFIGASIFWGCSMLSDVTLSSQLTTIPVNTFYSCQKLSEIVIPPGVTEIGSFAFCWTALVSVTIPSAVTYIEYNAFASCKKLESIVLPPGLTEISHGLFENCSRLRSITIPSNVTVISDYAFRECNAMTDLTMNTGLQTIGKSAFSNCESLQFVEIPSTVTLIGDDAFSSCYDLISITIPQTTVTIGAESIDTGYQRTIYCNPGDVVQYAVSNNIPYQYIVPVTITFDANGGTGSKTVTQNCGTRFPTLPVVAKNGYTCYGWLPAAPIITPNVNTTYTAQWRPNIYTITFDANGGTGGWTKQKSYGDALFAPAVTKELYLFDGWSPSVPATVPAENAIYTAQWRPIYTYTVSNGKAVISSCDTAVIGDLIIPPTLGGYPVVALGYRAFEGCTGLTDVTIPATVTFIEERAFYGCTSLSGITLPNSVTGVGNSAFQNCTNLEKIDIPDTLTDIGAVAFFNTAWFNAKPNGNVYIGTIYYVYKGFMQANAKITVSAGTTAIADCAFSGRSSIVKVSLPESLIYIGASAFYGCTGLQVIVIPESVQSIGKQAFDNCTALDYRCYPESYGHEYADENIIPHTLVVKITFDANGGTGTIPAAQTVLTNGAATLPSQGNITRNHYTFLGWAITAGDEVPLESFIAGTSNCTLYAVWSRVPVSLVANENEAAVIEVQTGYIYGLEPGVTKTVFENSYISISGDGRFEYTMPESGSFGTGTQVRLIDNVTGETLNTYTLVIYGDVNGDGSIDGIDAGRIVDYENYMVVWNSITDAAYIKAGDLNGDGQVDGIDAGITVDAENYIVTINQSIGLVN